MAVSVLPTKEWRWGGGVRLSSKKAQPFGEAIERNAAAGEKWRESQARNYIHSLIVVVGEGDNARPSPVAISTGYHAGYTAIETVLDSAAMRAMMVKRALEEAKQWRKRYEAIKELAAVFNALDAVTQDYDDARRGMSP